MKFCYDCANTMDDGIEKCHFCGGNLNDTEPKEAYHLKPGTVLKDGCYLFGRAMGYDGLGITYAGFDLTLQRRVAIEEYFPTGFADRAPENGNVICIKDEKNYKAGFLRFLNNTRDAIALFGSDPTFQCPIDYFEENNTAYAVMEYLEGVDLKHYIMQAGGKLPYEKAIEIIEPVCGALAGIHKKGIVHRAISPNNIFITKTDSVRLFTDSIWVKISDTANGRTHTVLLKQGYAPPEQYLSRGAIGAFTDIYALGATFYRMITGIMPHDSIERMVNDRLKKPFAVVKGIPKYINNAGMRALALDYKERFQTADEFLNALENTPKKGGGRSLRGSIVSIF